MNKQILIVIILISFFQNALAINSDGKNKSNLNILFILTDDMGYADLGCYGGVSNTPNLDNLAEKGILFTNFYAAAPNCSPSRAGLMTGRSPSRVGMYNYRPPKHPMHLRDSEITIAEILKEEHYQTAHFGKWHLGCLPQDSLLNHPQPIDQGFDYSLGTENNAVPSHLNPVNFVRNGKEIGEVQGYSCQIVADEAISWLKNRYKKESPFFMYVAFHEPHMKVASPPELVKKYSTYPPKDAEYLANVENMDLAAGRLLAYLEENNLTENTLIFFSSDNGSYRSASNGNLRAVKSYLYDGGIRVPGIISCPAIFQKNKVVDESAGFVDMLPTICEIVGKDVPKDRVIDGTSILNLLEGKDFDRKNNLFWFFYRTTPEIAMRIDNYMIMGKDNDSIKRAHSFSKPDMDYINIMAVKEFELYDLGEDIGEQKNIINSCPEAGIYKQKIKDKLTEIQKSGYKWKSLPPPNENRKYKTDWVEY
ncbi:sulfatase-like hydrolase/transferase [Maribellus maritimus]|uniref:sulfatase-like hydrolase/transferase n=1 Tax=Maribellus maritimus TaxID=2870838 RepID=UPI001EEC378D|nr:sulfatase-like hydrolase/transferase [Maribellus maritimus]MCG6187365.1 sulfatase-like hydrolase/transferase [Maribellus maritimus]